MKDNVSPHLKNVLSSFNALSDPFRIQIVELLRFQELTAAALRAQLHVGPSKLSFHLKQLKEANLLLSYQKGRSTYYSLNLAQLVALEQYLSGYRRFKGRWGSNRLTR